MNGKHDRRNPDQLRQSGSVNVGQFGQGAVLHFGVLEYQNGDMVFVNRNVTGFSDQKHRADFAGLDSVSAIY